ncbi:MAG: hypothetical protein V4679_11470 [Pseudomonadota bacterium]
MSRSNPIVPAHVDTSVIGEEDPGASLEIFRREALKNRAKTTQHAQPDAQAKTGRENNAYLTINCSNNGRCFTIQVQWQTSQKREFTDLLGLVIAEHAVISDVAWAHYVKTGEDPVQLEMGATADGRAAVQVRTLGHPGTPQPRRKVLHEPFVAANDHPPMALHPKAGRG